MGSNTPQTAHCQSGRRSEDVTNLDREMVRTQMASQPNRWQYRSCRKTAVTPKVEAEHDQRDVCGRRTTTSHNTASRVYQDRWKTASRLCLGCGIEPDEPFFTQFAQGNTREHLGECVVMLISALTPRAHQTRSKGIWPHLSFSLEDVNPVSRAMRLQIRF